MSYIRRIENQVRALDVNDTSELCLLGVLFDDTRSSNGLVAIIRKLETGTWQPTSEVIFSGLERLLKNNHIVQLETVGETYFSITAAGIKHFFTLLRRPLPYEMTQRTNNVALKSYFLESVPGAMKKCVVAELIGYYSCQLRGLQEDCSLCPFNTQRKKIQNEQYLNHIKSELTWLEGLTDELRVS